METSAERRGGREEGGQENKYINKYEKESAPQPPGSETLAASARARRSPVPGWGPGLRPRPPDLPRASARTTSGEAERAEADLGLACLFV